MPRFSVQAEGKDGHLSTLRLRYSALCAVLTLCTLEKATQHFPSHSASLVPCTSPKTHLKEESKALLEKTYHSSSHRLALREDSVAGMWSPQLHSQHQVCHCWWIFGWDLVCCFQWNTKWGDKNDLYNKAKGSTSCYWFIVTTQK